MTRGDNEDDGVSCLLTIFQGDPRSRLLAAMSAPRDEDHPAFQRLPQVLGKRRARPGCIEFQIPGDLHPVCGDTQSDEAFCIDF